MAKDTVLSSDMKALPFFARFLSAQNSEEDNPPPQDIPPVDTTKFPSDCEDR